MALSLYEAAKMSRNPLARGVMLGVATTNELIGMLPFREYSGTSFEYNRELALTSVGFVSPTHTSITEGGATVDRVTVPMRLIEHDVDVYNYVSNANDPNGDQAGFQVAQQLKSLGRTLQAKAFTGAYVTGFTLATTPLTWLGPLVDAVTASANIDSDRFGPGSFKYVHTGTLLSFRAPGDRTFGTAVDISGGDGSYTLTSDNPNKWVTVTVDVSDVNGADGQFEVTFSSTSNEPDGLAKILGNGNQTVASTGTDGDALSLSTLDALLYEKVKVRENLVFCMNGKLKRKFMALIRASGGMTTDSVAIPSFGADGGMTDKLVPAYQGIPVLQVDDIPSTEAKGAASTLSSVYLLSLGEQGFYAGVQSAGVAMNADLDPYTARIMGLRMYDLGQRESKGANGYRLEWFGAFGLGSELAAARASEIITA